MLETPHVALGAAIAVKVTNPLLALPLALVTHFAFEPLPHWNPHIYTEVKTKGNLSTKTKAIIWTDSLTALGLGIWVAARELPNLEKAIVVLAACFLAVLPDLIEAPYYFLHWRNPFFEKLIRFQRRLGFDTPAFPGLVFQTIVVLVLLNFATH